VHVVRISTIRSADVPARDLITFSCIHDITDMPVDRKVMNQKDACSAAPEALSSKNQSAKPGRPASRLQGRCTGI